MKTLHFSNSKICWDELHKHGKAGRSADASLLGQTLKLTLDSFDVDGERKPFAIKTDRGTQFKVTFTDVLKDLGIKHLKSYPNFPQFNAKIERRFKDLTLFEINNPNMTLEKMIILESNLHNYVKSHKSLDRRCYLVLYYRIFGIIQHAYM